MRLRGHPILWILAPIALCAGTLVWAQLAADDESAPFEPPPPPDREQVSITERVGEQVPLDLLFTGEDGRTVLLGEVFGGEKPVVLNMVYYRCPGICNALLAGLTQTLSEMDWSAGEQFRVVTVSIDPRESAELAAAKKESYLELYGRSAPDGWRFLVGREPEVRALADAVGFGYRYEEGTGLYTHAPGLMIVTPDGRLSRYLLDVMFEPQTLELALVEASAGSVGTPMQRMLLSWCYAYDATKGEYVVAARKLMTAGGVLIVVLTFGGLGLLWRREWRLERERDAAMSSCAELQP